MKTIGSQKRETLQESGLTLIALHLNGKEALLNNDGKTELWVLNDDFAGYVIEIEGKGFEFARGIMDPELGAK